MSVEENLKAVHDWERAFNARDWDSAFAGYAESIVLHAPGLPEPLKGREAVKGWITGFVAAFPDIKTTIRNAFGQGDMVVMEEEFTGTHTGTLIGPDGSEIPATNKPVQMRSATVLKIENGQITEDHTYFDLLGMMAQLGLAP